MVCGGFIRKEKSCVCLREWHACLVKVIGSFYSCFGGLRFYIAGLSTADEQLPIRVDAEGGRGVTMLRKRYYCYSHEYITYL